MFTRKLRKRLHLIEKLANPHLRWGNRRSRSVAQSTRKGKPPMLQYSGFATTECSKGGIHVDNQSIQHTRWNCTYHIVFIPKYRRRIMYGSNKRDLVEIIKKLCEMKNVPLIEGRVCSDHIHMYVAIPPKLSVSEFMSYLKGKSSLMFFDRHPELRPKWSDRHF